MSGLQGRSFAPWTAAPLMRGSASLRMHLADLIVPGLRFSVHQAPEGRGCPWDDVPLAVHHRLLGISQGDEGRLVRVVHGQKCQHALEVLGQLLAEVIDYVDHFLPPYWLYLHGQCSGVGQTITATK